ncbi:DUF4377 domain-containing protein [Polaribacter sargassicola]|uniref:DUF4377 domain-containing protein n=1 Tax=Polaribacter sargassicola TaxID=2836891 RepID=UPI001F23930D|nr:DUF4377 domain-containing protein [Polaribacter sp. DS7-9]MCG1035122.1 DUF4377 domain-containing protein [Polaribacter sp. DS7-9]
MKNTFLILLSIIMASCASTKETEKTIWVNYQKVNCQDVSPKKCLQIQESDTVDPTKWTNLYSDIKGFNFVPGQLTKMVITEKKLPLNKVPADASSIERNFVKVVEVIQKPTYLTIDDLQGKWLISSITEISSEELKNTARQPFLKFDGNRLSGNNGCNSITTTLTEIKETSTFKVGLIMETKIFCENMQVSKAFNTMLTNSVSFLSTPTEIILLNKENQQTMVLKKEI